MTKNDIIRAIDTDELIRFSDTKGATDDEVRFVSLLMRGGTMRSRMRKAQLSYILHRQEIRMGKKTDFTKMSDEEFFAALMSAIGE